MDKLLLALSAGSLGGLAQPPPLQILKAAAPRSRPAGWRGWPMFLAAASPSASAQSWLRRWLAIRNEDCAAYPVQGCAELPYGAFRGMLYNNRSDGGEGHLPPLLQR
jgi:hypothetical protein